MLSIRFQRTGRSKQPYFRLIVQEKTKNPQGKSVEILGSYDPRLKTFAFKEDRVKYWLSQGAQATNTVYNLLIDKGVLSGQKKKTAKIVKPKAAAAEATPATTGTAPAVEAAPAIAETAPVAEVPAPVEETVPVEAAPVVAEVVLVEETPAPAPEIPIA